MQTIELDCPPGNPRPGDLIGGVTKKTGLEVKKATSIFFGSWTWDYSEVPAEEWDKIEPVLKKRIIRLYNEGIIRYGSW